MGWFIKILWVLAAAFLLDGEVSAKPYEIGVFSKSWKLNELNAVRGVTVVDCEGKSQLTNELGIVQLSNPCEHVDIVFEHPRFSVTDGNQPIRITKSVSNDRVILETGINSKSEIAAITFESLSRATKHIGESPALGQISVLIKRPEFILTDEAGCNAKHFDAKIFLDNGTDQCLPAGAVPGIAVHEYGHEVIDSASLGVPVNDIIGEAFADFLSAVVLGESRIGAGLYHSRNISWLRNIADRRVFPKDYGGLYSGSQIISNALWTMAQDSHVSDVADNLLLALIDTNVQLGRKGFSGGIFIGVGHQLHLNSRRSLTLRAHVDVIDKVLKERGLLPIDSSDMPLTIPIRFNTSSTYFDMQILTHELDLKAEGLEIPFEVPAVGNFESLALVIDGQVSYSGFLQVLVENDNGEALDIFIGQEEMPLPDEISVPEGHLEIKRNKIRGKILLKALDPFLWGKINSAYLRFYTDQKVPSI